MIEAMQGKLDDVRRALGLLPTEPEPSLPRDELEALSRRAQALEQLRAMPGWRAALDLMEARMDRAEFEMLRSNATDAAELLGLQRRARAYREMFDGVQRDIQAAIADGRRAAAEMAK